MFVTLGTYRVNTTVAGMGRIPDLQTGVLSNELEGAGIQSVNTVHLSYSTHMEFIVACIK